MYYTYILQSKKDKKWYTGATDDLRKRLMEHNQNEVQSTKSRGPFDVIYYEACKDKQDAFIREKYLKSGQGKKFLKNRIKRFLSLTGQENNGVHPVRNQPSKMATIFNGGFATLEVLIAFAVLILCISAVIFVIFGNQSIAIDSETNNEAISKAQALLEKARADSREDFNLVNPCDDDSVTPAPPCSAADPFYNRKLDVTQTDLFTKKVISTVSWQAGGRLLSALFTTLLTNPEAIDGGDTCSSILEGDWKNPQMVPAGGYEFGRDILDDTSSGFPITSIQTFNKKMYVTVNNTKGNNDETFFILDISDTPQLRPEHVLGKLDNSPPSQSDISEGLNAVALDGENYAYVANAYDSSSADCEEADNCAQLQVVDVTNPNNPNVVRNYKIDSVATSGKLAYGTSIFYKDDILYLGLAQADGSGIYPDGHEFYIIDVSNPLTPNILDSAEISNGVNSIFVKGNYAYVVSPNDEELKIFDVSSPGSINEVGRFNAPTGSGNGKSLYLVGNKLYLGKTVGDGSDFHILDNTNPASTLNEIGPGLNSASSINGLLVRDFLAFFITKTEFQIWDISDPDDIEEYASPLTLPPGVGGVQGSATDCEGNYIYVGSQKTAPGAGGQDKGYISIITGGP